MRRSTIASVALYHIDYTNRIVSSFDPDLGFSVDRNVGDVKIDGVDVQIGQRIGELVLRSPASVSYNDSELQDDIPTSNPAAPIPTKGKKLVETPKWTFAVRADIDVTENVHVGLQGKQVGDRFGTDLNDEIAPGYTVFDLDFSYAFHFKGVEKARVPVQRHQPARRGILRQHQLGHGRHLGGVLLHRRAAHRDGLAEVRLLTRPGARRTRVPDAAGGGPGARRRAARRQGTLRIATFNCSLNRPDAGRPAQRSLATSRRRAGARRGRRSSSACGPTSCCCEEFDYDAAGASLRDFQANYLGAAAERRRARSTSAMHSSPNPTPACPRVSTWITTDASAAAAMRSASANSPGSTAWCCCRGFPIDARARAHLPQVPVARHAGRPAARRSGHASAGGLVLAGPARSAAAVVEVALGRAGATRTHSRLHLLASHPTPPAFDGPEDRNGRRNHDEIRLWNDYLTPGAASYLRDDAGRPAASRASAFIVMGDQNSDPVDGASLHDAIVGAAGQSAHRRPLRAAAAPAPSRPRALQGGVNACAARRSALRHRRLQRSRRRQPARGLSTAVERACACAAAACSGRRSADPARAPGVGRRPPPSSDHRLVWIDVSADAARCPPGSDPTTSAASHPGH